MTNPFQAIFDDTRELLIGGFIVVVCLIILGTLATMPGITSEAKAVAEQGQQTISWFWLFYLGLPSFGIILTVILWIRKIKNSESNFSL